MHTRKKSITELARDLRKNPTDSEKILWQVLQKRRLDGYRFVRQKPFIYGQYNQQRFFFIADFYCAEKKLVIELDGKIHEHQKFYDYQKDMVLQKLGLKTVRISNNELGNLDAVKKKILNELE